MSTRLVIRKLLLGNEFAQLDFDHKQPLVAVVPRLRTKKMRPTRAYQVPEAPAGIRRRALLATAFSLPSALSACGGGGVDLPGQVNPVVIEPPVVTGQPNSQSVQPGVSTTFSVSATGTGLIYAWQRGSDAFGWAFIEGANASTFTATAVTTAMDGLQFRCVVTNVIGTIAVSAPATLRVSASTTLPSISVGPVNQTAAIGAGVTFSVSAAGTSLQYQWRVSTNGGSTWTDISGANAANYVIALLHAVMNGWIYQVAISGPAGSITSSPVTLAVSSESGGALHSFSTTSEGSQPQGNLVLGSDGALYGTTNLGGGAGLGTVYKISRSGTKTVLHSFAGGSDGAGTLGGLVLASDGYFYGTTANGGVNNNGTIYRMASSGAITILHSFGGTTDGTVPYSGLTQAIDGSMYGTTHFGGSNNVGTIYKISQAGVYSVLHSFGGVGDGRSPKGEPFQAADGNVYGTTTAGGANGSGVVYRLSANGSYVVLHSFGASTDGQGPVGRLIQANDGHLYGTTYYGGVNGTGAVFRLTLSGTESVIHSFGANGDGQLPYAGLIQGMDGALYGTTNGGGALSRGSVFRATLTGSVSVIHSFGGATDGQNPLGGLIQASNSALYGTCQSGGSSNLGTVFELMP
jgi:uncharacterized repeat protein (TIGR03803 family)